MGLKAIAEEYAARNFCTVTSEGFPVFVVKRSAAAV
jgi:hypothetical protein